MNKYYHFKHFLFIFMIIMSAVYEAGGIINPSGRLLLLKTPDLLSQYTGIELLNLFYLIGLFIMLFRYKIMAFALLFLSLIQNFGPQTLQRVFLDSVLCFMLLFTVFILEVVRHQKQMCQRQPENP